MAGEVNVQFDRLERILVRLDDPAAGQGKVLGA